MQEKGVRQYKIAEEDPRLGIIVHPTPRGCFASSPPWWASFRPLLDVACRTCAVAKPHRRHAPVVNLDLAPNNRFF